MNSIDEQRSILEKLSLIVVNSAPIDIDLASCEFLYHRSDDGSASVRQKFSYMKNGEHTSAALDKELRQPVMGLVKKLHHIMVKHTDGDWESFILSIDKNGKVSSKFNYIKW